MTEGVREDVRVGSAKRDAATGTSVDKGEWVSDQAAV